MTTEVKVKHKRLQTKAEKDTKLCSLFYSFPKKMKVNTQLYWSVKHLDNLTQRTQKRNRKKKHLKKPTIERKRKHP